MNAGSEARAGCVIGANRNFIYHVDDARDEIDPALRLCPAEAIPSSISIGFSLLLSPIVSRLLRKTAIDMAHGFHPGHLSKRSSACPREPRELSCPPSIKNTAGGWSPTDDDRVGLHIVHLCDALLPR
jgi:hypothetical protein